MDLKIGMRGDYSFWKDVTVCEIKEDTVVMIDKSGGLKEVYKDLFVKYFEVSDSKEMILRDLISQYADDIECSIRSNRFISLNTVVDRLRKISEWT
jgi:hypothetical protein